MENFKTLEKKLEVKDVKCADCMYYYKYSTPMKGFCTRMNRHSSEARDFCTKTQWYTEMCVLSAAMDSRFK